MHMIISHGKDELEKYGINREWLKWYEKIGIRYKDGGIIAWRAFLKRMGEFWNERNYKN